MTPSDLDLIDALTPEHPELVALLAAHERFEAAIVQLARRRWLSGEEQATVKRLKRNKLAGRDRIEQIIGPYRVAAVAV
jgi:uncharacterized protein YdcH (DUF465 family)